MGAKQSSPAANGRTRAYSGSDLPSSTSTTSNGNGRTAAMAMSYHSRLTGPREPQRPPVNILAPGRGPWEAVLEGQGQDPSQASTSPTAVEPTAHRSLAAAPRRRQRGTGPAGGKGVPGC
ncbi:unnamed protein product [Oncorhynchus mykiss]|uniref:Uncharacterized protein n=1 Tax=Oncorhynchus mykiss TaxID=8022 RepID=A0A060Y896_ONCMY|nr:unnamed protein product [Oncorhynchus mykiss]